MTIPTRNTAISIMTTSEIRQKTSRGASVTRALASIAVSMSAELKSGNRSNGKSDIRATLLKTRSLFLLAALITAALAQLSVSVLLFHGSIQSFGRRLMGFDWHRGTLHVWPPTVRTGATPTYRDINVIISKGSLGVMEIEAYCGDSLTAGSDAVPKSTGTIKVPGWARLPSKGSPPQYMSTISFGWPMPAIVSVKQVDIADRGINRIDRVLQASASSSARTTGAEIWWPGFVVNSMCYLTLGVMCVIGCRCLNNFRHKMVISWRLSRARCARCGYDLGQNTSSLCPECGARNRQMGI